MLPNFKPLVGNVQSEQPQAPQVPSSPQAMRPLSSPLGSIGLGSVKPSKWKDSIVKNLKLYK